MGKSTISMVIFNSKLLVHQRVLNLCGQKLTVTWSHTAISWTKIRDLTESAAFFLGWFTYFRKEKRYGIEPIIRKSCTVCSTSLEKTKWEWNKNKVRLETTSQLFYEPKWICFLCQSPAMATSTKVEQAASMFELRFHSCSNNINLIQW